MVDRREMLSNTLTTLWEVVAGKGHSGSDIALVMQAGATILLANEVSELRETIEKLQEPLTQPVVYNVADLDENDMISPTPGPIVRVKDRHEEILSALRDIAEALREGNPV